MGYYAIPKIRKMHAESAKCIDSAPIKSLLILPRARWPAPRGDRQARSDSDPMYCFALPGSQRLSPPICSDKTSNNRTSSANGVPLRIVERVE
jgi:hypothetical protein